MDERQADRIIALLESIKNRTDLHHRCMLSQEAFLRGIAHDVNTIRAIIVGVLWWLGILFVFKYLGTYFIENPLF